MWTYTLPVLYSLLVWWLSTGLVLCILGPVARRPRIAVAAAVAVLAMALAAIAATSSDAGILAAYIGFTAAILVWGVQEVAFLAGWITGPWRAPAPADAGRWSRTGYAVAAILYHELALAASGLAILAASWGGANPVGAWTFAVLFAMRVSAKLNVFLGVPNLTESFLPPHLAYLKSFFARKPMNLLFPVSVTAATTALVLLAARAAAAEVASATALTFAATLLGLAIIEHWFLVLPLPVEALWAWSLGSPNARPEPAGESGSTPLRKLRTGKHPAVRSEIVRRPGSTTTRLRVVSAAAGSE